MGETRIAIFAQQNRKGTDIVLKKEFEKPSFLSSSVACDDNAECERQEDPKCIKNLASRWRSKSSVFLKWA